MSAAELALVAVAALLAGGIVGSRVATHRRPASIYDRVAARIVEERSGRTGR